MKRSFIIWIVLIGALVYIASIVGPMYYKYEMVVHEVRGQIKVAHMYDEYELLERVSEKVKEWGVPVDTDKIVIDLRDDDIIISMRYHVDKVFFTRYKRRFNFKIREKGVINRNDY